MEEETVSNTSSVELIDKFAEKLNKLLLTFYKNLKYYVKANKFTDTHITLLKRILSKMYGLQTNQLIFESGLYPKILNLSFLATLAMTENLEFSPKSMLFFMLGESKTSYNFDVDVEDIEAKNSFEMRFDELMDRSSCKEHKIWLETHCRRLILSRKIWFMGRSLLTNAPFTYQEDETEAIVESIFSDLYRLREENELRENFSDFLETQQKENYSAQMREQRTKKVSKHVRSYYSSISSIVFGLKDAKY
jgi:hypothetical protein